MGDLLAGWPYWIVYAVFFCGAMTRAHLTYAVGRGLRAGAGRGRLADSRLARELEDPRMRRAEALVARFGAPVISLSFLTVGVQTLLNAAAGALRMPLRRYTPAAAVGALAWAAIYTTIGFAVIEGALGRLPWWWLLPGAGLIAVVVVATRLLRRRLDPGNPPPAGAQPEADRMADRDDRHTDAAT